MTKILVCPMSYDDKIGNDIIEINTTNMRRQPGQVSFFVHESGEVWTKKYIDLFMDSLWLLSYV